MYLDKAKKEEIFAQYGNDAKNTGSAESQIALFTYRIAHLTEHVKQNRKDFVTSRSLTQLASRAARLSLSHRHQPLPRHHQGSRSA